MKKYLLSFLLIAAMTVCSGQKVNKKCILKEGEDEFTGLMTKSTQFESVGKIGTSVGEIRFKLSQNIPSDSTIRLYIQVIRLTDKTINENSKLIILTKNGPISLKTTPLPTKRMKKDSFESNASTYHGREFDVFTVISSEQIKILKNNDIEGLRFYYSDSNDEYTIVNNYRNQYEFFVRTLPCFN